MRKWLICFDWDGTLADSMDVCVIQIQKALERMHLESRPVELIRKCNGPTYAQSVEILNIPPALGPTFLEQRRIAEMETIQDEQRLFPGVAEMLQKLHEHAVLAVVSNGLPEYLRISMELTNVSQYFTCVEPLIEGRSKVAALHTVMQRYPGYETIMIGDRIGDIQAGKENKAFTIAAGYGYGNEEEYCHADECMDTVEKLTARLLQIIKT